MPFEGRAVDYNQSLATATEKQILLNILRAAAREPMSFSFVSSVDSRSAGEAEIGLDVPFGSGAGTSDFVPIFALQDQTPRFTVSPLMHASFMRSFARPVELGILERLLSRDFPNELVMRLAIRDIGWQSEPLRNSAQTADPSPFRRRLRLLLALGLSSEPLLGDNTLIEDLDQESVLSLIEEVGVASDRLSIVPDRQTGAFDVIGEPGGFRLCFERPPVLRSVDLTDQQLARAVDLTCRLWVVSQLTHAELGGRDLKRLTVEEKVRLLDSVPDQLERNERFLVAVDEAERVDWDGAPLSHLVEALLSQSESGEADGVGEQELGRLEHFGGLAITIRSPLEMMEYLGLLVRSDRLHPDDPRMTVLPDATYRPYSECPPSLEAAPPPGECSPLSFFRLRQSADDRRRSVGFHGERYHVANAFEDATDASTEVVAVLSNLMALFIEGDEAGDTARVTILP